MNNQKRPWVTHTGAERPGKGKGKGKGKNLLKQKKG